MTTTTAPATHNPLTDFFAGVQRKLQEVFGGEHVVLEFDGKVVFRDGKFMLELEEKAGPIDLHQEPLVLDPALVAHMIASGKGFGGVVGALVGR